MHKAKCHDSSHDDVVRNGLGHVDVHDMEDSRHEHGSAGRCRQDKQKSSLLIEPKCCMVVLHTSQSTAYCIPEVVLRPTEHFRPNVVGR